MQDPTMKKALDEFMEKGAPKLAVAKMNPFLSEDRKEKMFGDFVASLSDETVQMLAPQLVNDINMKKKKYHVCKNTDDVVVQIITWIPKLKPYDELIRLRVNEYRSKHGLPL